MPPNQTTGPNIAHIVDMLSGLVRGGKTPDEAADQMAWSGVPQDLVRQALQEFRERTDRIRTMREPGAVVSEGLERWYPGPGPGDRFWPAYKERLFRDGWTVEEDRFTDLDSSSTKIVSLLSPPGAGSIRTKGLVLGHVQSGKTANYTAVIAKAADAGYRFFIVLSGFNNNALRNQTQKRLDRDLISPIPDRWITVTEPVRDFRQTTNVNAFLSEHQAMKVLGVVKKHSGRLGRLLDWLRGAREEVLRACPVLIIDDEADQASPNAHRDPTERTRINQLLIEILRHLPKAAYVGYTATPFANLLIDPEPVEDLYPRDFVVDLPKNDKYFGAERIFGRDPLDASEPDTVSDGLDMIRHVPDHELGLLQSPGRDERHDFMPALTPSLADALLYFWMVTAARHQRGQRAQHSTMLVHTTQYTLIHHRFRPLIEEYRVEVLDRVRRKDAELLTRLREQWEREQAAVPPESVGEGGTTFEELWPFLEAAVDDTEVALESSRSDHRVDYDVEEGGPGKIYVVIGGNILSRGLTLEGLSVSFFVRGASAYDTLLQMGRWFGYRPGYGDLPRIWMTRELENFFYDLATVEREIRVDVDRYKNGHITPLDFGVRIRTHPHLAITARLKMQNAAVAKMSFAGSTPQTLVFKHKDRDWLDHNLDAGRRLIRAIEEGGITRSTLRDRPSVLYFGVDVERVLDFLADYKIHEHHVEMRADLMRGYIRDQNALGRIHEWNVAVVGIAGDGLGTIDLGSGMGEVPLVNRSRYLRGDLQYADVKALISQTDIAVDVDRPTAELRATATRSALLDLRDREVPDRGLLLLYPISKDSTPQGRSELRRNLEADQHVLGMSLVFPDVDEAAGSGTPQTTYITVALPDRPIELPEDEDYDEDDD